MSVQGGALAVCNNTSMLSCPFQANKAQVAAVMLASGLMDAVVRDLIDLASPEGGRGEGAQQAGQVQLLRARVGGWVALAAPVGQLVCRTQHVLSGCWGCALCSGSPATCMLC